MKKARYIKPIVIFVEVTAERGFLYNSPTSDGSAKKMSDSDFEEFSTSDDVWTASETQSKSVWDD